MTKSVSSPHILISVAEISADFHAASLARSILRKLPTATLFGCGGSEMAKAGVDVNFLTAQLGYVKIRESWFSFKNKTDHSSITSIGERTTARPCHSYRQRAI